MFKPVLAAIALCGAALPAAAELITKSSPHSVPVTMDKLEAAVTGAGATVFARVDHGAGAASVEMELAPAELLIFGNPRLGTPVMQADILAGLDLPLRVLVAEGSDGTVSVTYRAPASLAEAFDVPANAEILGRMTGALDNLTNAAIAE